MANPIIRIQGSGVAALCCLQLLKDKGYMAKGVDEPPRSSAILISPSTQKLLADIFRTDDLFRGLPAIRERVVAWGQGDVRLPHFAVVASQQVLLDRLRAGGMEERAENSPKWTILTTAGLPEPRSDGLLPVEQMSFGSRTATVHEVDLEDSTRRDACWIEAVENGWLFLLPISEGRGSLIAVGCENHGLLAKSRLIAPLLRNLKDTVAAELPAYPRISVQLTAEGWLACGSAAMTFDPLCGEGVGNAAREAILACASVAAIESGESASDVMAEYELRLRLGFLRHLENCREFYARASMDKFWVNELHRMDEGIAWSRAALANQTRPRYRLVDFALRRIE